MTTNHKTEGSTPSVPTKNCSRCKKLLALDSFSKNRTRSDGRNTQCRVCRSAKGKTHYQQNLDAERSRLKASKRNRIRGLRRILAIYFQHHPCVDCGEKDPIVLTFDHVSEKSSNISEMVAAGLSWVTISKEIDKCEVRCANCHLKKTAARAGWDGIYKFDCVIEIKDLLKLN